MSEEKEVKQDENVSEEQVQENISEVKEQSAEEKYAELNDKYVRIHAEFDNYRRRTNKEKLDLIATANAGVLKDLLPVLDDFERAILNNKNVTEPESLKKGFAIISNKSK